MGHMARGVGNNDVGAMLKQVVNISHAFARWRHCHAVYSAPQWQCSHCKRYTSYSNSVRLSVCLSVTRRYCLKTTARSMVQFALSDSKMCLVL